MPSRRARLAITAVNHRLIRHQTMLPMIPRLFHPPNLATSLVMGIRPIEADHFPPAAAMLTRNDGPMVGHQSVSRPAGLKHGFVHGPTAAGAPGSHTCPS